MQLDARRDALLVIDLQPTFCPADPQLPGSGELPVPDGAEIVGAVNALLDRFPLAVATRDCHPDDHLSFASQYPGKAPYSVLTAAEVREWESRAVPLDWDAARLIRYLERVQEQLLWPDHARRGTPGARLHPRLRRERLARVVRKGEDRYCDSYSGFFDNGRFRQTELDAALRARGARRLFVCGLALDYCCYFTASDGLDLGYEVCLIEDASRGIDRPAGSCAAKLRAFSDRGGLLVRCADILGLEV